MEPAIKSPFEGEPRTIEGRDARGRRAFAITANVLTPESAQLADLAAILSVPFYWYVTWQTQPAPSHFLAYAVWLLLPLLLIPMHKALARYLMRSKVYLEVTEDTFAIGVGKDCAVFDRLLAHSFSVVVHDKAADEQDELDAARQSSGRPSGSPARYYTRAFIVTYDYLGQRNDIVAMMGQREANALQARLTLCDRLMETQRQKGKGLSMSPQDEWATQTGDIEELA
ncbi:hypothetical protein [Hyphomicrobium sp.]|uniref:hypothetical protein n=1 Tax=Hyphomicrobium sp. TaxID=82 RepID=UPI003F702230